MNDETLLEQICRFARRQSVMTLAVDGNRGPWAAAVLYVVSAEANADILFYFLSCDGSQHVQAATPDSVTPTVSALRQRRRFAIPLVTGRRGRIDRGEQGLTDLDRDPRE